MRFCVVPGTRYCYLIFYFSPFLKVGKCPDDVREMFESHGFTVLDCIGIAIRSAKKKPDTSDAMPRIFCYVEMGSLDDAILSLTQLSRYIRNCRFNSLTSLMLLTKIKVLRACCTVMVDLVRFGPDLDPA